MEQVAAYKEYAGGLFQGIHEPIIDMATWKMGQSKMKKPEKTRTVIDDQLPLRGILKCHCHNPLSGALSRGKSGQYFCYYKCRFQKHNNISAVKAHDQLLRSFQLMSLQNNKVKEVKDGSQAVVEVEMKSNKQKAQAKKLELEKAQENLFALEEKWIRNEISKDTYDSITIITIMY